MIFFDVQNKKQQQKNCFNRKKEENVAIKEIHLQSNIGHLFRQTTMTCIIISVLVVIKNKQTLSR